VRIETARPLTIPALLFLAAVGNAFAQQAAAPAAPPPPMRLTSTAFADSTPMPAKYSCDTQPVNISPPLEWTDAPKDTASFALIFHDLDPRPRKGIEDNLHWMVWNIPPEVKRLREGLPSTSAELPDGIRQTNRQPGNNANFGYQGPCPPSGIPIPHHYTFDLFALDQKLSVPQNASRDDVMKAMDGHVVGHAVLIGLFHR